MTWPPPAASQATEGGPRTPWDGSRFTGSSTSTKHIPHDVYYASQVILSIQDPSLIALQGGVPASCLPVRSFPKWDRETEDISNKDLLFGHFVCVPPPTPTYFST